MNMRTNLTHCLLAIIILLSGMWQSVYAACTAPHYGENIFETIRAPSCEQRWAYHAFLDTNAEWQGQANYHSKQILGTIEDMDRLQWFVDAAKLAMKTEGFVGGGIVNKGVSISDTVIFADDFYSGIKNLLPPGHTQKDANLVTDITKQIIKASASGLASVYGGRASKLNGVMLYADGVINTAQLAIALKGIYDVGKSHSQLNTLLLARLYLDVYYRHGMNTKDMMYAYYVEDNDELIKAIAKQRISSAVFDDEEVRYFFEKFDLTIFSVPAALLEAGIGLLDSDDYDIEEVKAYIKQMQTIVDLIVRNRLDDDTQFAVSVYAGEHSGYFPLGKKHPFLVSIETDSPLPIETMTVKINKIPKGFKLFDLSDEHELSIPYSSSPLESASKSTSKTGKETNYVYYLKAPTFFQSGDIEVEVSARFEKDSYRVDRTFKETTHIYSGNRKGILQISPSEGLSAKINLGDSYVENKQMLNLTNVGEKDMIIFLPIYHQPWLSSVPVDLPYDWLKSVPAYLPYDKYALLSTDTQKGKIAFWPDKDAYKLEPGTYETPIILRGIGEPYSSTFTLEVEAPSFLSVKGQEEIEIAGKKGGSFYPNRLTYTLENTGNGVLHWKTTLNDNDYENSWFEISPTEGHLKPNSITILELNLNKSFMNKIGVGVETTSLKFENVDFPNNSHPVLIKLTVVEDLTKAITVSVADPSSAVFRPGSSTLLSWFTNKSSPNDKMSLLMKRDKIGDKLDESEEGKSWYRFAVDIPNDGSEQVQIPETVDKADDWRFYVTYNGDFGSTHDFSKRFSIANEVTTVVIDNRELSHAYQPGHSVRLSWNSTYILPSDEMVLAMKRDSAHALSAPDNVDWYRFTLDTKNDGSEWVKIPETVSKADDWRFYVSHVNSGVFGSSDQFTIDDGAIAVSINDSALANAYQPGNNVLLSWELSNTLSSDKTVVVSMKRDAAAMLAEPDNINWYRFSLDTPDDGSEQLEIPLTVAEGSDWRFYVKHVDSGAYSASHKFIIASSAIAVTVDSSKLSDAYRPGSFVSLSWFTSNNALPDDKMVLSMKRDSAASLSEPDGKNWYRFVLDTPNDGSELVQIPETVTEADDWRFYVRHVNSGVYSASQRFGISMDAADAATIHSTAEGGNWKYRSTWIEGRVPTENDVVEIRGEVTIHSRDWRGMSKTIRGLIVTSYSHLRVRDESMKLVVNGNLINHGIIDQVKDSPESPSGSWFIEVGGNVVNYGEINVSGSILFDTTGNISNHGKWQGASTVFTLSKGIIEGTMPISGSSIQLIGNIEIKNNIISAATLFLGDRKWTKFKSGTLTVSSEEFTVEDFIQYDETIINGNGMLVFSGDRVYDLHTSKNIAEVKFVGIGKQKIAGGNITAKKVLFGGNGNKSIQENLTINASVVIEEGITLNIEQPERYMGGYKTELAINGDVLNRGSLMRGSIYEPVTVSGNITNEGTWDVPTKVFWENVPNSAYYELNITEPSGKWSKHIIRSNSYKVTNLLDTTHYWTVRANINGEFTPWFEIKNINGTPDFTLSLVSISDFVWYDENGNGIQDTSESGIADVEVELFTSDGLSQGTVTTDSNGAYTFSDIFAGDYYLQFTLPSGYIFTQQNQGNDDDIDSDVKPTDGTTAIFTLIDGVNNFSANAGIRQLPVAECGFSDGFETGALSDYWSTYTTKNGRVQVSSKYPKSGNYSVLLDDNNRSNSKYSHAAIILTANLAEQSNVFLNFWWREFGDEDHPEDGIFISDDNGAYWSRIFSFNNEPRIFRNDVVDIVAQAANKGLTLNERFQIKFQFYDNYSIPSDGYAIDDIQLSCEMPTANIGNLVWHDTDGNGIKGSKERGIANVNVELFTSEGVSQGTTKTDSKGAYVFTDIAAGDYYLQFSLPTRYSFTSPDKGSDEGLDSDVNPENNTTAIFTVKSGVDNFSLDAGVQQSGTLEFGVSSYTVAENGGLVTIEVTRSNGSANAVSINYASSDSTAIAASDYTSTSGTLSWAKGDTAPKHFTVKILDDKLYENDETFTIALSNPTGGANLGTQSSATVTIVMDAKDSPILTLSTSPTGFAENAGANASIGTVTRNSLQGALTVNLSSSDTTEVRVPNSVTIPDGKTSATFAITAIDDMTADGLQTVILTAGATDYASATTLVNVTDNLLTDKIDSSGTCLTGLDCDRLLSQHLIIKQTDVLNMTTHIVVDPRHVGLSAKILIVAVYQNAGSIHVRDGQEWKLLGDNPIESQYVSQYESLPKELDVQVISQGKFINLPGEFSIYVGYRLNNGVIVFNGKEPLHFFVANSEAQNEEGEVLPEPHVYFDGKVSMASVPQASRLFSVDDTLDVSTTIYVDSQHIDQMADIVLTVAYQPDQDSELMRYSQDGVHWETQMPNQLYPVKEGIRLTDTVEVPIFQGNLNPGQYTIYVGYRLAEQGTLVFNGLETIELKVQ